jgi:BirA family biotin operon repressor/biotin-[acetyl-CoA-carboxylase] ligase
VLADGQLHSGQSLALELHVSRGAIGKAIGRLRRRGIEIDALPRRGYRLPARVELLREPAIRAVLSPASVARLRGLALKFDVASTNSELLAAQAPPLGQADILLCELQHAGRGRLGRTWVAPFGGSLALSFAWVFADAREVSPTLSLCVGVAVVRALARAGARGIGLKWPNDVWAGDRKLGGILVEVRALTGGSAHVVIGVGLNVQLTPGVQAGIEATGVRIGSLADACGLLPSRNFIAGVIIDELFSMLACFERLGFAGFHAEWSRLDALRDRPARIVIGETVVCGTARGVDAAGALRLEREGCMIEYRSGEVSLRPDGDEF